MLDEKVVVCRHRLQDTVEVAAWGVAVLTGGGLMGARVSDVIERDAYASPQVCDEDFVL